MNDDLRQAEEVSSFVVYYATGPSFINKKQNNEQQQQHQKKLKKKTQKKKKQKKSCNTEELSRVRSDLEFDQPTGSPTDRDRR